MSPPLSLSLSLSLSLWQEIALTALGLLSLSYALLFRVWSGHALGADGVFALAIAALVAAVAVPSVFDTAGSHIVEWSPLPEALGEADARAAELAALPGRLIDGALERLGFAPDAEEAPETEVGGPPGAAPAAVEAVEAGWLTARVRPSVDGLVALLLRLATAAIATLVLVLALLLRVVISLARRLRRIGDRLAALETSRAKGDGQRDPTRAEIEPV